MAVLSLFYLYTLRLPHSANCVETESLYKWQAFTGLLKCLVLETEGRENSYNTKLSSASVSCTSERVVMIVKFEEIRAGKS